LIDELGNFTDAVEQAASIAGLDQPEPHLIYPEEEKYSLFNLLSGQMKQQALKSLLEYLPVLSFEWTGLL